MQNPDMHLLLAPNSVRYASDVTSKKHALDILSSALADAVEGLPAGEILEGLASRERLGATVIGDSVAMPHTRMAGIDEFVGSFLKLSKPIDFDAPDGSRVALLFGLLIPQDATEKELKELRSLVRRLRDPELQRNLTDVSDPRELHRILTDTLPSGAAQDDPSKCV
jgi:PTS system nitrogen regulatory IIA component